MFKEGYNLIHESLNLLSVYGPMHSETAACSRLLGRLNYLMGDFAEALSYQQKAAIMNERCLGIDHPSTITDYVSGVTFVCELDRIQLYYCRSIKCVLLNLIMMVGSKFWFSNFWQS